MKDVSLIVNNGEKIGVINPGDIIVRCKSRTAFKKKKADNVETFKWTFDNYVKSNDEELDLLIPELNKQEVIFLGSIISHISYSNCLEFKNHICLDLDDFIDITKICRTDLYSTVKSLMSKDILYQGKNSRGRQYYINPWLYHKGENINKVLKSMFRHYKVHSRGNVTWSNLNDGIPI